MMRARGGGGAPLLGTSAPRVSAQQFWRAPLSRCRRRLPPADHIPLSEQVVWILEKATCGLQCV
eukprot:3219548-Lingulodinium_polyedra.AAC.1